MMNMNWDDCRQANFQPHDTYDLIVAANVVYDQAHLTPLPRAISTHLMRLDLTFLPCRALPALQSSQYLHKDLECRSSWKVGNNLQDHFASRAWPQSAPDEAQDYHNHLSFNAKSITTARVWKLRKDPKQEAKVTSTIFIDLVNITTGFEWKLQLSTDNYIQSSCA